MSRARLTEGQKLARAEAKRDRERARELRLDAREKRGTARALTQQARGKRERAAKVRLVCRMARAALKQRQRERRVELLDELKQLQQRERDELAERCARDRERIVALADNRRAAARALRLHARSEQAQARALAERHRSTSRAKATRRGIEHIEEVVAFVRDAIERSGAHPAFVAAWDRVPLGEKRALVVEADAKLRAKHGKRRALYADEAAGVIVEKWLEQAHGRGIDEPPEDDAARYYEEEERRAEDEIAASYAAHVERERQELEERERHERAARAAAEAERARRRRTSAASRTIGMEAGGWPVDAPLAGPSWRAQGEPRTLSSSSTSRRRRSEAVPF